MLKIDSAGLSKIETGHKKMKPEKLSLLAEIFELDPVSLKELFHGEEIALKLYENNCSISTLVVAEERVKYLKTRFIKQGNIDF
jgi:hypothetical protein